FVDEFPEFDRRVIDSLRQPLEDKIISISRARGSAIFPANFILIATMNPCPCGYYQSKSKECTCTSNQINNYKRKISGPIVDRIDLWVEVSDVNYEQLSNITNNGDSSEKIKEKILLARQKQIERFGNNKTNSDMSAKDIEKYIDLKPEIKVILNDSATRMKLSARAYHKIIKLARTIADLDNSDDIKTKHILGAFAYRPKDN
ncbi:ATP-binding protein, partial [Candidatus Parcubacteria bacterium]|nr:ATP-binding protein [Candidatus Parcubacteria bacterium]